MLLCDKDGIFSKMTEHIIDKSHMNLNFAQHVKHVKEQNMNTSDNNIESQCPEESNGHVNIAFDRSDM